MTSGISTALVGWSGSPYVVGIEAVKTLNKGADKDAFDAIRIETRNILLKPRYTTVYDPSFLGDTRRPFATWELLEQVDVTPTKNSDAPRNGEETVAETSDERGKVLGRWIVSWDATGSIGKCRAVGTVQRCAKLFFPLNLV